MGQKFAFSKTCDFRYTDFWKSHALGFCVFWFSMQLVIPAGFLSFFDSICLVVELGQFELDADLSVEVSSLTGVDHRIHATKFNILQAKTSASGSSDREEDEIVGVALGRFGVHHGHHQFRVRRRSFAADHECAWVFFCQEKCNGGIDWMTHVRY